MPPLDDDANGIEKAFSNFFGSALFSAPRSSSSFWILRLLLWFADRWRMLESALFFSTIGGASLVFIRGETWLDIPPLLVEFDMAGAFVLGNSNSFFSLLSGAFRFLRPTFGMWFV
jgi:hypothetical protein|tara:strand:+ start:1221 stop:1568 length:348 start_codon:yes stop_codon:yes gene_type:complete